MRALVVLALLALIAPIAGAQGEAAPSPQNDWMVHMEQRDGAWGYLPGTIVLVPGGLVQLMVFGDGRHSLTLDGSPAHDADISTTEGTVRTAEFNAPTQAGRYPFHDKYHPEAVGVLQVVAAGAAATPATIGVIPGGYESTFAPNRLTVTPGAEVTFKANGTFGHNLRAVDDAFTAGDLKPGEESTFQAPTAPGEYPFECRFHRDLGMIGTLVVAGSPATPTPADPSPAPQESNDTAPSNGIPGPSAAWIALAIASFAWLARKRRGA